MMATVLLLGSSACRARSFQDDSISSPAILDENIIYLTPTYLDDAIGGMSFGSNWFVSLQGGGAAFLGKPIGCNDFWGRLKPLLNVGVGKWFTPHIGVRLGFQGFKFLDYSQTERTYQNVHADLLWNVLNGYKYHKDGLGRWGLIPFAGIGIINNSFCRKNPFAISYGLICQYRLSQRLVFSAELANSTTFQDFDGMGDSRRLGDHLLQGSLGFSVILGKTGWKRIIDPMPYIYQNDLLYNYSSKLKSKNDALEKRIAKDEAAMREWKKIMKIKGILNLTPDTVDTNQPYPKNCYSGLNALRERMRNSQGLHDESTQNTNSSDSTATRKAELIGAPINFFFKINTATLTSKAQQLNIAEIAKVAKEHHLLVRIVGAADKATGTSERNKELSLRRAEYISELLQKRDVPKEQITTEGIGGVSKFKPEDINRYTRVLLYQTH